ncbi:CLUMA_CG012468, isoform A [Clunio marinus]|uniref:CLUMA_CG012468, isoform A n=1 Tax=Clunio marinus TaxID=568069 RepID=A0A1J1IFX3_9DIPT|nr:CLUMA_CG012468, isoform A [Clunio marinus]
MARNRKRSTMKRENKRHDESQKAKGKTKGKPVAKKCEKLRRIITDMKFTTKSFNNHIDSSTYQHNFNFTQESQTRKHDVFKTKQSRTDTGKHSLFNRLMTNYNMFLKDPRYLEHQPTDDKLKQIIRDNIVSNANVP